MNDYTRTNFYKEEANPRAKAVESFVNLLAEIRSYGEGLIIADQIASKLHQDVIKNTNVKILHRTMDKEDRDLIGNAINLTPSQILDIAELKSGEAIVHNKDVHTAFMVSVDRVDSIIASESTFINFTKAFLESNESLKYELPLESRFYIPNFDINIFSEIPLDLLKQKCLQFISAILLDGNIKRAWEDFTKLLKFVDFIESMESSMQSRLKIYLFSYAFRHLTILSNMRNYKNLNSFSQMQECFINFIESLQKNEFSTLQDSKEKLKECFYAKNLSGKILGENANLDSINFNLIVMESRIFYVDSNVDVIEFFSKFFGISELGVELAECIKNVYENERS